MRCSEAEWKKLFFSTHSYKFYLGRYHIIAILFHNMGGWTSHGNPLLCFVQHGKVMLGLIRRGLFSASDLALKHLGSTKVAESSKANLMCINEFRIFSERKANQRKAAQNICWGYRAVRLTIFFLKWPVQRVIAIHLGKRGSCRPLAPQRMDEDLIFMMYVSEACQSTD